MILETIQRLFRRNRLVLWGLVLRRSGPVLVAVRDADGLRGSWTPAADGAGGEITIAPGQPWCVQHLVLVHELLHAADDLSATTDQRVPHADITRMAPVLLELMTGLGLWPLTKAEAMEAIRLTTTERGAWAEDHQP